MLIALNIEEYTRPGIGRLFGLLRRNRVRAEHLCCDSAVVRSIVYEHRRGQTSWATIRRFVPDGRGAILCPEGLTLADESGLWRFDSRELSRRMCENAALYLLREAAPARVRTALIDDAGEYIGLCPYLANETDSLRAVTRRPSLYLEEADRILNERGAVVRVCAPDCDLSDVDLIIAPSPLMRTLRCARDAVILSGDPPRAAQNAPVIRGYTFDLPGKYRGIMPPYLDEMYFAAALYAAGAHELGSEVFRRCRDGGVLHTRQSLLGRLRARLDSRKMISGA